MTIRVILNSGAEFAIKCDKFTLERNGLEIVTGYNIKGITENKPVYLDFQQIAAIVRVFSDEKPETAGRDIPALPYPDGDTRILSCPHCGSGEYLHNADENENAFCGQCGQAIKWEVAE